MVVDSPRARTERALAELVAAEGPRAVTVARIRIAVRVDQSVAADVVHRWRATDVTEEEARAFEAPRAIIRQAVLTERAKQDDAVNQAASAATEEVEETRQEADRLRDEVNDQREVAGAAREEAAEARGKLFVYEQQTSAQAAQVTEPPAPAKDREQSAATATSGKNKA